MSTDDAPVAKDEELNTPEEKEAWLRAHGVEIESAEDRKKNCLLYTSPSPRDRG